MNLLRKYSFTIVFFHSVINLYGCATLVTPVAGNFDGEPEEIVEQLSPEAIELIQNAYVGFADKELVDSHVHMIGLGANGTDNWVNPEMREGPHWSKQVKFAVYKNASGIQQEEDADQEYVSRLIRLIDGMYADVLHIPEQRFLILAFDRHYDREGQVDLKRSPFYVSNQYVVRQAQIYPQFFVPVISVHPYRKDALQSLERWHKRGVRYVKWLPNAQGIDPSDEAIIPFYEKMVEYGMVLITHTGKENAVEGDDYQHLGNPQLLRLPLQLGVKVIMSHLATLGDCIDVNDHDREVSCYRLAVEMLEDDRYEDKLFADISTITQYNHVDHLQDIIDRQDIHRRLVNGSDYPLPAINILYRTSQLEEMGFITESERYSLNEIYSYNPLLFDFVLKRTVKSPQHGNKLRKEVFVMPEALRDSVD